MLLCIRILRENAQTQKSGGGENPPPGFFLMQKTAYELLSGLVCSAWCIRDCFMQRVRYCVPLSN